MSNQAIITELENTEDNKSKHDTSEESSATPQNDGVSIELEVCDQEKENPELKSTAPVADEATESEGKKMSNQAIITDFFDITELEDAEESVTIELQVFDQEKANPGLKSLDSGGASEATAILEGIVTVANFNGNMPDRTPSNQATITENCGYVRKLEVICDQDNPENDEATTIENQTTVADDTRQNAMIDESVDTDPVTVPKPTDSGISVASWTHGTQDKGVSTDFCCETDVFDELIQYTKEEGSSGSDSDISVDRYPTYRKLNRGGWKFEDGESEVVTEVFERSKCPVRTITVGDDECDINDIRELLTWEINTRPGNTVVPLPYQQPQNQEDVINDEDANVEIGTNYNEYIKECDKKVGGDDYKVPIMLQMTPAVSVFESDGTKEREEIAMMAERIKCGTPEPSVENALIVTNKISELRMDMRKFHDDLQAHTDKYNKQYQDLMETFIQKYNECNEREKVSKVKSVDVHDNDPDVPASLEDEEKLEAKAEDLPIVKHEISCTLEMQLAKESD